MYNGVWVLFFCMWFVYTFFIAANDQQDTEPGAAKAPVVGSTIIGTTFINPKNNLTYEITGIKLETYYDEDGW